MDLEYVAALVVALILTCLLVVKVFSGILCRILLK
jgi:hypothetical protein